MYIVIGGGGKVGEALARRLLRVGNEVAIIERQVDRATRLANVLSGRFIVVCGNCCDSMYLSEAGIEHANLICAVTGRDDDNLATCEVAHALFKVPRCIARVNDPRNERIFNSLGITAISSTSVIAQMIVEEASPSGSRATLSFRHGEYTVLEVEIPNSPTLKAEGGLHVGDLEMPSSALIAAVSHGERYEPASAQTVLLPGDGVIVCAKSDVIEDARRVLLEL